MTFILASGKLIGAGGGLFVAPPKQITFVQTKVKDPATSKVDFFDNGNGISGKNTSTSNLFTSGTTTGNALLIIPMVATDGPNRIFSVSDPVNGAWTEVGSQISFADCNCDIHPFIKFNASPLLPTSWSGTGAVNSSGVLTIGSGSGPFRLGQRVTSAHLPVPGPGVGNDVIIVSLLSGSLGAAGSTYQLSPGFSSWTTGFSSEAMTTSDIVTINYNLSFAADYPGSWMAELAHTDGSSFYFSGNNDSTSGAGTDTVSAGTVTAASSPGLVIAFSLNGAANGAPNPPPPLSAPVASAAGTGWPNSSQFLNFDWGFPLVTLEWLHFTSVGSRTPTFSPNGDSRLSSVAIALLDGP